MVVAIDGPAGTGKSTVSQEVAARTGFFFLNSGKFYRAVSWKALRQKKSLENPQAIIAVAADIVLSVEDNRFLVDGKERNAELHAPEIDQVVAQVSAIPEVRVAVNSRLRRIAGARDVVVEGRDMSTVVFPDAEIKIYLDADVAVRAQRRRAQHRDDIPLEEVQRAMEERDSIDRTKPVGALRRASDAVYIDTTDLTLPEVCERVVAIILDKKNHGRSI